MSGRDGDGASVVMSESAKAMTASESKAMNILSRWWQVGVLLLFIVLAPETLASTAFFNLFVLAGIWGIAVVGISLLASLGGQFTFGQAGVVSVGAYATAIITAKHGGPAILGIVVGIVVSIAVALLTAPILRLRGWYLTLATLALGYLFLQVETNLDSLTGGNDGIFGIPPLSVLGFGIRTKQAVFVTSWSIVLILTLAGRNLVESRFGRAARAIQADEEVARSLAIPASSYKTVMWVLAAIVASLSGSMYAHYARFISPGDFNVNQSTLLFIAILLGGYRSVFGALVALVFLISLPEISSGFLTSQLIMAITLILVYLISPGGLAGMSSSLVRRLGRVRRHA
jgi:branched-chain amino acid transport system permease protein